jgi:hypothetical protein
MSYRGLRALIADRKGNAVILAVAAVPPLIGGAGLAVDTVQWTVWKRQLQYSADAAAIAGALALAQGKDVDAAALHDLSKNNRRPLAVPAVIQDPPVAGAYAGDARAVRVILSTVQALPFSSMFVATPVISATGTAAMLSKGKYCVISLESTSATGITMQGNATVNLGCGMATNSRAANAVTAGGSSVITASPVAAVGGLSASSNYASGTTLIPYSIAQTDPFAGLPQPTTSSCSGAVSVGPNSSRSLSAGCYRGMDIKGTLTLSAGTYVIDGSVSFGAQANITGSGVTIILTSSNAASNPSMIGTIDISGGAQLNLTAPDTGTYAGVLIYQDRRANYGSSNKINGNSASILQGAIYMPKQLVEFNGTTGMSTQCLQIVSRNVTFIGNSTINNVCPPDSGSKAFDGVVVKLVE